MKGTHLRTVVIKLGSHWSSTFLTVLISRRVQCKTMFPSGGHLELDPELSDTIFEGDHPRTFVTKFGSNLPGSFRGDL